VHLAIQAQPVAQRSIVIDAAACRLIRQAPQRILCRARIELAQVVEGDAWLRQSGQHLPGCLWAEVAQQAIADAFVRYAAQLFLDALDRRADIGSGLQAHRVQAGEPAQGARQVDSVEQFLTAMPFQLHQCRCLAAPGAKGLGQGGQQQVVDLGAIGRRCLLQQRAGQCKVEAAGECAGMAFGLATLWVVGKDAFATLGKLRLPVAQFVVHRL